MIVFKYSLTSSIFFIMINIWISFYLFWLNKSFNSRYSSKNKLFNLYKILIHSCFFSWLIIDCEKIIIQNDSKREIGLLDVSKKRKVNLVGKRMFINHFNTIPIVICLESIVVYFIVSDHKCCCYTYYIDTYIKV